MFDKDLLMKQLMEMSAEDVALLVRDVMIESGVEFTQRDTGIVFDGLSNWDYYSSKVSANAAGDTERYIRTGYCFSNIMNGKSATLRTQAYNHVADYNSDGYWLIAA